LSWQKMGRDLPLAAEKKNQRKTTHGRSGKKKEKNSPDPIRKREKGEQRTMERPLPMNFKPLRQDKDTSSKI